MDDISLAKKLLIERELSLIIIRNGKLLFQSKEKGLHPLLRVIEDKKEKIEGGSLADKIIGRAAAMLIVYGGIREVYTPLLSNSASPILEEAGINCQFEKSVPAILNEDKTQICPMEKLSQRFTSPCELFEALKERLLASSELVIQTAEEEDTDKLVELFRYLALYHEELDPYFELLPDFEEKMRYYYSTRIRAGDGIILIASFDDKAVGFIDAHLKERPPIFKQRVQGYIANVFVLPEVRGKGIGRKLVEGAIVWLRDQGALDVELSVAERNESGRSFWQNLGFRDIRIVMRKIM